MKILPNNSSLIYSGRIDVSDPFAIVWTYPGTFVRMKFKGTQLFIHVRNKHNYWNNYLALSKVMHRQSFCFQRKVRRQ